MVFYKVFRPIKRVKMGRGGDGKVHSRLLSVSEVKKHTQATDGWVVIKNKVS